MKTNKEETLLELVNECPVTVVKESVPDDKGEAKLERVKQLKELGFTKLGEELERHLVAVKLKKVADYGYIEISDEKVASFLQRKVDRYNHEHRLKEEKENEYDIDIADRNGTIEATYHGAPMNAPVLESFVRTDSDAVILSRHPESIDDRRFPKAMMRDAHQYLMFRYVQQQYLDATAEYEFELRFIPVDYRKKYEAQILAHKLNLPQNESGVPEHLAILDTEMHDKIMLFSPDRGRELTSSLIAATWTPEQVAQLQAPEPNSLGRAILAAQQGHGSSFANALARSNSRWYENMGGNKLSVKTCDYNSPDPDSIGQYAWTEVPVKDYKGIPPKNVIDDMQEHKEREVFDYFTIASVKGIHDPLLLGRITGVEDRFYVAQWGQDVSLDDLI